MAQRSKTGGNRRRSLYLHDAAGLSFFSYFCIGRRTAEEKARKEMVVAAVQLMDKPNDMWREEREKTRKERGRACEWHSRGGSWRRQLNWAGLSLGTVGVLPFSCPSSGH